MSNLCHGSLKVLLDMRNLHLLSRSFLPSWPKTALLPSKVRTHTHVATALPEKAASLTTGLHIFMAGFDRRRCCRRCCRHIFIDQRDTRSYVCVCDDSASPATSVTPAVGHPPGVQ